MKHTLSTLLVSMLFLSLPVAHAASLSSKGSYRSSASSISVITPSLDTRKALTNPSIELTGYSGSPPVDGICSATALSATSFDLAVLWTSNLPESSDSDSYEFVVPGYGIVSRYDEDNVGYSSPASNQVGTYGLPGDEVISGWSVPANTTVTHRMITWPTANRVGTPSFYSELDVNCTTGAIVARRNGTTPFSAPSVAVAVPTNSARGLMTMGLLILLLVAFTIHRRRQA